MTQALAAMRAFCAPVLLVVSFAILVHAQVETCDPLPVPDLPGYRTPKGDCHPVPLRIEVVR